MMSPFFCPHDPYEDITLDAVQPPFHPLILPHRRVDQLRHAFDTYLLAQVRPLRAILSLSDSTDIGFLTFNKKPSARPKTKARLHLYSSNTLRTRASTRWRTWWYTKRVWDLFHSFLKLDGRVCCRACQAWIVSAALFCYIILGLNIYGMYDSWRLILYISFF